MSHSLDHGGCAVQLYWSFKSIPELADLPAGERGRLWRAAWWRTFRHWELWVAMIGLYACASVGRWLGSKVGHPSIGSIAGAALGGLIVGHVLTELARPYLRAELAKRQRSA